MAVTDDRNIGLSNAARAALARIEADRPAATARQEAREKRLAASAQREQERVDHLVLGKPRPVQKVTTKRHGRKRQSVNREKLSPGIEEAVQMQEDWSHKQGTPETLERAARCHTGALAQLHANGAIDNDQLEWAAEIANVHRSITADVSVAIASLEARVDQSRSSAHLAGESIYRVRMHQAYGLWRAKLPMPKRLVLDMIVGDAIGYTIAARRYGVHNRKAKRLLIRAIDHWPDCVAQAFRNISTEDLEAINQAIA